jgi:hypothetical protein
MKYLGGVVFMALQGGFPVTGQTPAALRGIKLKNKKKKGNRRIFLSDNLDVAVARRLLHHGLFRATAEHVGTFDSRDNGHDFQLPVVSGDETSAPLDVGLGIHLLGDDFTGFDGVTQCQVSSSRDVDQGAVGAVEFHVQQAVLEHSFGSRADLVRALAFSHGDETHATATDNRPYISEVDVDERGLRDGPYQASDGFG